MTDYSEWMREDLITRINRLTRELEEARDALAAANARAETAEARATELNGLLVHSENLELQMFKEANFSLREQGAQVYAELDKTRAALREIDNWAKAYPLDVFPEPDFKRVREVLKEAGITLDSVSASNMRHVIQGVERITEAALKGGAS